MNWWVNIFLEHACLFQCAGYASMNRLAHTNTVVTMWNLCAELVTCMKLMESDQPWRPIILRKSAVDDIHITNHGRTHTSKWTITNHIIQRDGDLCWCRLVTKLLVALNSSPWKSALEYPEQIRTDSICSLPPVSLNQPLLWEYDRTSWDQISLRTREPLSRDATKLLDASSVPIGHQWFPVLLGILQPLNYMEKACVNTRVVVTIGTLRIALAAWAILGRPGFTKRSGAPSKALPVWEFANDSSHHFFLYTRTPRRPCRLVCHGGWR